MPLKLIKRGYKVWCLCDPITGYLLNYQIYLRKEETSEKEILLSERVVFNLISGYNFEGKHLYFDNFFTCLGLLENLKSQNIKASGTIRPDLAGIPSDFFRKNKMEQGDYKSMIISNSIVFIWMDTKHVFLASNYHKDNEVAPISRRFGKWSTNYNQLSASNKRL